MSGLRQDAPLLDAYLSYTEQPHTPFTIPGHKQRASSLDAGLGAVVDTDVPLYGGLDEIKLTRQTLATAERLAATLWTADFARFSTGGSTHANQAAILALGQPGDKVPPLPHLPADTRLPPPLSGSGCSHCPPICPQRSRARGPGTSLAPSANRRSNRRSHWHPPFRAPQGSFATTRCAAAHRARVRPLPLIHPNRIPVP